MTATPVSRAAEIALAEARDLPPRPDDTDRREPLADAVKAQESKDLRR